MQNLRSVSSSYKDEEDNTHLDVVIIGAGWAGLAAAKTLQQEGQLTFKMLEARSCIGGRSQTSYELGCPVDVGSAWIHGTRNNPIHALLNGLPFEKCDAHSGIELDETGAEIEKSEFKSFLKLRNAFMKYMRRRQRNDDEDVSLEQTLCDYLDSESIPPDSRQGRGLRTVLEAEICYEYGASLSELSMFWWDSDEELSGGDYYLAAPGRGESSSGYSKVISNYAETVVDYVKLETNVTKIVYDADGWVTVNCVRASNGDTLPILRARHAIVTLPLGVLQENNVEFSPPLPKPKRQAIQDLGMAIYNKVVLCWDRKVMTDDFLPKTQEKEWISQMPFPSAGNDGDDTTKPRLRVREFYCPNHFSKTKQQQDNEKIVMIGCCYGEDAKQIETMTDTEVREAAVQSLRGMFGNNVVPDPTQCIVTRWASDPYARGSYSFQKVGAKGNQSRRDLAASPVGGNIWFAGEACHIKYPGTTHGALLSGESVGRRVSKAIQN